MFYVLFRSLRFGLELRDNCASQSTAVVELRNSFQKVRATPGPELPELDPRGMRHQTPLIQPNLASSNHLYQPGPKRSLKPLTTREFTLMGI